jgi:hypothetical protein
MQGFSIVSKYNLHSVLVFWSQSKTVQLALVAATVISWAFLPVGVDARSMSAEQQTAFNCIAHLGNGWINSVKSFNRPSSSVTNGDALLKSTAINPDLPVSVLVGAYGSGADIPKYLTALGIQVIHIHPSGDVPNAAFGRDFRSGDFELDIYGMGKTTSVDDIVNYLSKMKRLVSVMPAADAGVQISAEIVSQIFSRGLVDPKKFIGAPLYPWTRSKLGQDQRLAELGIPHGPFHFVDRKKLNQSAAVPGSLASLKHWIESKNLFEVGKKFVVVKPPDAASRFGVSYCFDWDCVRTKILGLLQNGATNHRGEQLGDIVVVQAGKVGREYHVNSAFGVTTSAYLYDMVPGPTPDTMIYGSDIYVHPTENREARELIAYNKRVLIAFLATWGVSHNEMFYPEDLVDGNLRLIGTHQANLTRFITGGVSELELIFAAHAALLTEYPDLANSMANALQILQGSVLLPVNDGAVHVLANQFDRPVQLVGNYRELIAQVLAPFGCGVDIHLNQSDTSSFGVTMRLDDAVGNVWLKCLGRNNEARLKNALNVVRELQRKNANKGGIFR